MAGDLQAKKAGYPLDMESFWLSDKFRIRADSRFSAIMDNQKIAPGCYWSGKEDISLLLSYTGNSCS
jgi:hypothetical protein